MDDTRIHEIRRALSLVPGGVFIMTSQFEGKRGGVRVKSVMPCADEPVLIAVSAWKGHGIEPIIRDSHFFALNLVDPEDRLILKKFGGHLSDHADQFDSLPTERLKSTSPIIRRAVLAIDCEVVRHFDMEADHELYVGLVLAARVFDEGRAQSLVSPHHGVPSLKAS